MIECYFCDGRGIDPTGGECTPCRGRGLLDPATIECAECSGVGEVRHRRYGARDCPEPTEVCPACGGEGR